jgi:hypothetical protein
MAGLLTRDTRTHGPQNLVLTLLPLTPECNRFIGSLLKTEQTGNSHRRSGHDSLASDGFFYGATTVGGTETPQDGVIFKLSPNESEQVLVNFDSSNGASTYCA